MKGTFRSPCARVPVVLALSLAPCLLAACGGGDQRRAAPPPVPVTTAKVVRRAMPVAVRAIGHVEPIAAVEVRSRIGGELYKVHFAEGQSVRAGDVLFSIDPRPYEAALAQAEAGLARDQALLAKAEADIARYADLVKKDFVTREQYDQITTQAASLRASMASGVATVDNARLNLGYCTIASPLAGRTGNLRIKAGNLIKANDEALVTINQMRPIYATFSLPGQALPEILKSRGDGIMVAATLPDNPGAAEQGALTFLDNHVDEDSGTILVKATFPNEGERLWPGLFVDLVVTLGIESDRVVAPAQAVQTSQQGLFVFVVGEDDAVELRRVKVARMDEKDAVVEEGLSGGETVVTDGQLRLVPGARVEVRSGLEQRP
jgi:multidrug efflux system membrane fusion protein